MAVFHDRKCWRHHVDHVLCRGEQRVAACVSWTQSNSQQFPLSFCNQISNAYVRPSVFFGLEFVAEDRKLQQVKARFFQ